MAIDLHVEVLAADQMVMILGTKGQETRTTLGRAEAQMMRDCLTEALVVQEQQWKDRGRTSG